MNNKTPLIRPEQIEQAILLIRGQRVLLDRDLAVLYGVETKNLNRAVRRNLDRFPADFMFQLTREEAESSRCQFGTLKKGQNIKYLPQVFTQEGVAMLSSMLRSPRAVQVNIAIMRVFVRLRETLALRKEKAELESRLERDSLSASTGERARVRCRLGIRRRCSWSAATTTGPTSLAGVYLAFKQTQSARRDPSTINPQLSTPANQNGLRANDPKSAGKWIERFEEWLADSGFLKEQTMR